MALAFLAHNQDREYNSEMYNDQLMMMYLVISIYMFAKQRPIVGVLLFSAAYGMKAGALLLIPAMLGSVQYFYGIVKLIQVVVLLVGF
jgi:Gpi18-like mannosyltransferase